MPRRRSRLSNLWWSLAWLVLVACLPWWLGLPLLMALAVVAVLLQARLQADESRRLRRALRWGLPGLLLALWMALGADVVAGVMALAAALAGATLLAGMEAWLDRDLRRDPAPPSHEEWPQLARAPIGPAVQIIELLPPDWGSLSLGLLDACGERLRYGDGIVHFIDGTAISDVGSAAGFSTDGRWFFARLRNDPGIVLWDRQHERPRRLPGFDLCGWHGDRPWITRGDDGAPQAF